MANDLAPLIQHMTRVPRRMLVSAVFVVVLQPRVEPARWWRSASAVTASHLSDAQREQVERLYQHGLPAEAQASIEAAQALNEISHQLDDVFVEEKLLRMTERLLTAQAHQAALERELDAQVAVIAGKRRGTVPTDISFADAASSVSRFRIR